MASTQVGFRVCALVPTGWSEWVVQALLVGNLALYILQYVFIGIVLIAPKTLHTACNFLALVLAYYSIWRVEKLIGWLRPFDFATTCQGPAAFYDDSLNLYGAPDPNIITGIAIGIAIIYIQHKVYKNTLPWAFIITLAVIFIATTISDFLLTRVTVAQFFTNIGCTLALLTGLLLIIHSYYDVFPQYRRTDGVARSFIYSETVNKHV